MTTTSAPPLQLYQPNSDCRLFMRLNQLHASEILGAIPSTVCRRYRKTTNHGWPYRYMREFYKTYTHMVLHQVIGRCYESVSQMAAHEQRRFRNLINEKKAYDRSFYMSYSKRN